MKFSIKYRFRGCYTNTPFLSGVVLVYFLACMLGCTGENDPKTLGENKNVLKKRNKDTVSHLTPLVLWYTQPALLRDSLPYVNGNATPIHGDAEGKGWEEALPIGNGRLGAMIFGGAQLERIQLNEQTLWDGSYVGSTQGDHKAYVEQIRQLIFEGKYQEAQTLAQQNLTGNPANASSYQTLGDLVMVHTDFTPAQVTDYYRDLHIDSALATVHFHVGDKLYTREIFASYPDNVIVIKLTCDKPASINMRIAMYREAEAELFRSPFDSTLLIQRGQLSKNGMKFETQIKAAFKGGSVQNDKVKLEATNVDELTLYISASTSYEMSDYAVYAKKLLLDAYNKPYEELKANHINAYKKVFAKVDFGLASAEKAYDIPTNVRLENVKKGALDKYLIELAYQYGRYLLICSSRPGFMPANMQGIWNEHLNPLFGSGYQTFWTLPLIYAPAESANLAELKAPFVSFVDTLALFGREAAKSLYGSNGWLAHDFVSLHGNNLPTSHAIESISPLGGIWISNMLFETYEYNSDKDFLKNKVYPIMKGATLFVLDDYLTKLPEGKDQAGKYVVCPSISGGNEYIPQRSTDAVQIGYGSALDQQLVQQLVRNMIKTLDELSSSTVRFDTPFRKRLQEVYDNLATVPNRGDELGEWMVAYTPSDKEIGYISQLYGLFPGRLFNPWEKPELKSALLATLDKNVAKMKNSSYTYPLVALWYARLGFSSKSNEYIQKYLANKVAPNLLSVAPPFAIDGNMTYTASISNMLLQEYDGELVLTPAIPGSWGDGWAYGLRAKGGFEFNFDWVGGNVTAKVKSLAGNTLRIRSPWKMTVQSTGKSDETTSYNGEVLQLETRPGDTYVLRYKLPTKGESKSSSSDSIWPELGLGIDLGIKL